MVETGNTSLRSILNEILGTERAEKLFKVLVLPSGLVAETGDTVSRALIAQALNMILFEDLLVRVPAANDYVNDCLAGGRTVLHDHGAVRTVAMSGMGAMPAGEEAIVRLLRPLGYERNGVYPLERLKMTGRSYAQAEYPEEIAQFFISELHPERFSEEFQQALTRIMATSIDPLTPEAKELLAKLEAAKSLTHAEAVKLLPVLVASFDRQHEEPALADYEALLAESAEAAWISTEGNAFNHATDRVPDVQKLTDEQKALGRPMKPAVEVSKSGRVSQTAFLAAKVQREFRTADGTVTKEVPGSFYEFITRDYMPSEDGEKKLDLGFDSSNAQAIFKMTANAGQ